MSWLHPQGPADFKLSEVGCSRFLLRGSRRITFREHVSTLDLGIRYWFSPVVVNPPSRHFDNKRQQKSNWLDAIKISSTMLSPLLWSVTFGIKLNAQICRCVHIPYLSIHHCLNHYNLSSVTEYRYSGLVILHDFFSKSWHIIQQRFLCNTLITWLLFFSHSVMSNSLRPHGLQYARLPCPSLSPRDCSNSCPLSWWCHPTISSSVIPFSSCPQSFPASGSFPMSWLFASASQNVGVSASVFPMNIQDQFPLGLTGLISLQSKGLSRVFSNTTVWKHQFFSAQLSLWSNSHICTWLLEKPFD